MYIIYMNGLNTGVPNFIALCRYRSVCFYKLKVCGNFAWNQVYWHHFPSRPR